MWKKTDKKFVNKLAEYTELFNEELRGKTREIATTSTDKNFIRGVLGQLDPSCDTQLRMLKETLKGKENAPLWNELPDNSQTTAKVIQDPLANS